MTMINTAEEAEAVLIARDNDRFRVAVMKGEPMPRGMRGEILASGSVSWLGDARFALYAKIAEARFDETQPYNHHDEGEVEFEGATWRWSIELVDIVTGETPTDPSNYRRVRRYLNIARADEWKDAEGQADG